MSKIRIDKFLANSGIGSRSEIKAFAKQGLIKINGQTEKDTGRIIDTELDQVCFKDEEIRYIKNIYLMMNKPDGVLSATEDKHDETVIDLLDSFHKKFEPFPVGRLDKDTEGLLLLTNDGQLAHDLLSPKKHIDKEYYVEAQGQVLDRHIQKFEEGLQLHDYRAMPAKLVLDRYDSGQDRSFCHVTIREGKFHQVKNMFAAIGLKVLYLKRIRMGSLMLDESLELGDYRELTQEELKLLTKEK